MTLSLLPRRTMSPYREELVEHGGLQRESLLLLDVVGHVAQLLLHLSDRLEVRRVVEGVAAEEKELKN